MKKLKVISMFALAATAISTMALATTTRYEAEAKANTLVGCISRLGETPVWYSGAGFVGSLGDDKTDVLQFNNVIADATGDYTMYMFYKTYDPTRPVDLQVNGGSVVHLSCLDGPNGLGSITQTISLNAGSNKIALLGTGSWAPDIDYIDITGVTPVPEPSLLVDMAGILVPAGFFFRRKLA